MDGDVPRVGRAGGAAVSINGTYRGASGFTATIGGE
jgi:hypothetical protein